MPICELARCALCAMCRVCVCVLHNFSPDGNSLRSNKMRYNRKPEKILTEWHDKHIGSENTIFTKLWQKYDMVWYDLSIPCYQKCHVFSFVEFHLKCHFSTVIKMTNVNSSTVYVYFPHGYARFAYHFFCFWSENTLLWNADDDCWCLFQIQTGCLVCGLFAMLIAFIKNIAFFSSLEKSGRQDLVEGTSNWFNI